MKAVFTIAFSILCIIFLTGAVGDKDSIKTVGYTVGTLGMGALALISYLLA